MKKQHKILLGASLLAGFAAYIILRPKKQALGQSTQPLPGGTTGTTMQIPGCPPGNVPCTTGNTKACYTPGVSYLRDPCALPGNSVPM